MGGKRSFAAIAAKVRDGLEADFLAHRMHDCETQVANIEVCASGVSLSGALCPSRNAAFMQFAGRWVVKAAGRDI